MTDILKKIGVDATGVEEWVERLEGRAITP
jgi:hypothetical protein